MMLKKDSDAPDMDPPAVETVNAEGKSPYMLLCEHASNYIPSRYKGLGLDASELERHIAWDIGVAPIARELSRALDAPLVLSGYSRLLIDCNRPIGVPTSIPEIGESTLIPGNTGLSDDERAFRAAKQVRTPCAIPPGMIDWPIKWTRVNINPLRPNTP